MKSISLLTLSTLLPLALANPEWATNPPTLDPNQPIYLATVFMVPSMSFAAWAPPADPALLEEKDHKFNSWCHGGQDVTDNISMGSRTPAFTFKGMDGLKIHDFFTDQAYISRHGSKFANCFVGPQAGDIGFCDGRESEGEVFIGKGTRVWSCYVILDPERRHVFAPREEDVHDVTGSVERQWDAKETGSGSRGEEQQAVFTAAVTGS